MYQQANPNEMPGIGTTIVAVYKPIWKGRGGVQYLPGGGTIDGNNARDPANTYSGNSAQRPDELRQRPGAGPADGQDHGQRVLRGQRFRPDDGGPWRRSNDAHGSRGRGGGNRPANRPERQPDSDRPQREWRHGAQQDDCFLGGEHLDGARSRSPPTPWPPYRP